jgi:hypothetical protein
MRLPKVVANGNTRFAWDCVVCTADTSRSQCPMVRVPRRCASRGLALAYFSFRDYIDIVRTQIVVVTYRYRTPTDCGSYISI